MLCRWSWTPWLWWCKCCLQAYHSLCDVLDKCGSSFRQNLLQPLVCYITMCPSLMNISFDLLILLQMTVIIHTTESSHQAAHPAPNSWQTWGRNKSCFMTLFRDLYSHCSKNILLFCHADFHRAIRSPCVQLTNLPVMEQKRRIGNRIRAGNAEEKSDQITFFKQ